MPLRFNLKPWKMVSGVREFAMKDRGTILSTQHGTVIEYCSHKPWCHTCLTLEFTGIDIFYKIYNIIVMNHTVYATNSHCWHQWNCKRNYKKNYRDYTLCLLVTKSTITTQWMLYVLFKWIETISYSNWHIKLEGATVTSDIRHQFRDTNAGKLMWHSSKKRAAWKIE